MFVSITIVGFTCRNDPNLILCCVLHLLPPTLGVLGGGRRVLGLVERHERSEPPPPHHPHLKMSRRHGNWSPHLPRPNSRHRPLRLQPKAPHSHPMSAGEKNELGTLFLQQRTSHRIYGINSPVRIGWKTAQCRQYHKEQLSNGSKVGRSLGSTCGGQKRNVPS
jgi:hypothetical protein